MKNLTIVTGVVLFAMIMVVMTTFSVRADTTTSFWVEYPVPGSPLNIVVESPGKVWFTLPNQNLIGTLIVTSTTDYEVITYTIPTVNSEPYDLDYALGMVWFTERAGNKIGRLNPTTSIVEEFQISTINSAPTGIDVSPNGQVWFTEYNGNQVGRLTVTSTISYTVDEFMFNMPSGQLQDITVENDNSIWFTAPGVDRLVNLQPSSGTFYAIWAGGGSAPWNVVMGGGMAWITAYDASRIGRYLPQTISDWRWYSLGTDSGPTGLAFDIFADLNRVWFVEEKSGRVGRLDTKTNGALVRLWEWPLPSANSHPQGIAVDSNGHAWVAESAANKIAEWCPPYVYSVYLPLVIRQ